MSMSSARSEESAAPTESTRAGRASRAAQRTIAILLGLCIGLAAVCVFLWRTQDSQHFLVDSATQDESVRRAAIEQLVQSGAIYDSFPDYEVGRIFLPSLAEREIEGLIVSTNQYGMRERAYELPKPADVLRVVLLGDSFIMGEGMNVEQRCGAHLERYLQERAQGFEGRIECLQIGIGSWNVTAECAFARRQLSLLRPDLLIQVLVGNDQDDSNGVRGFGAYASFSSQHRERADALLMRRNPRFLGFNVKNWIAAGLDYESRSRYAEGLDAIQKLRRSLSAIGSPYLLMLNYAEHLPCAQIGIGQALPEQELTYLSEDFRNTPRYRLSKFDAHWSALANEEVAKLFYALIVERDLLPALKLPVWKEAQQRLKRLHEPGRAQALATVPLEEWFEERPISAAVDFEPLTLATAAQIHGGIDADGKLAPYGSLILDARALAESGGTLVVEGAVLDRSELDGGKLEVYLDERLVGELTLKAAQQIELRLAIPSELRGRPFVSLRLISSDYAYVGDDLRNCRSVQLRRVALE